jgi:hypothetical protein
MSPRSIEFSILIEFWGQILPRKKFLSLLMCPATLILRWRATAPQSSLMATQEQAKLTLLWALKPQPGLIYRAINYLFTKLSHENPENFILRCSYLEIYNETLRDLLNIQSPLNLTVRQRDSGAFHVENSLQLQCDSAADIISVISEGNLNRSTRGHALNSESSRSHAIFTIFIENLATNSLGKINFCDLAGSENLKMTKNSEKCAVKESSSINLGLFTLGNVISTLSDMFLGRKPLHSHVNYRDSLLTKLLWDSLGGKGVSLMISCLSPSISHFPDTLRTLFYANKARNIRNRPAKAQNSPENLIFAQKNAILGLKRENFALRSTLERLGVNVSDALRVKKGELSGGKDENGEEMAQKVIITRLEQQISNLISAEKVRKERNQRRKAETLQLKQEIAILQAKMQQSIAENSELRANCGETESILAQERARNEETQRILMTFHEQQRVQAAQLQQQQEALGNKGILGNNDGIGGEIGAGQNHGENNAESNAGADIVAAEFTISQQNSSLSQLQSLNSALQSSNFSL